MRRLLVRCITSVATVGALVAIGPPATAAASERSEVQQTVRVVGTGSSVHLSRSWVYAGSIRFKVSSTNVSPDGGGSDITLFRVKHGHRLSQVFAALQKEFNPSTAAQGTRALRHAAVFRGLAEVSGTTETVTEYLGAGTYYAMDLSGPPPANGKPAVTKLHVRATKPWIEHDSDLASDVHVSTKHDKFHAPRVWPHKGTYTFTNRDDTLHFMVMIPVKDGTTDAQIQEAFSVPPTEDGPPPAFFREGPSGGNDVVSPRHRLQVTYNLPKGTYALACFVADEETGMPHAAMGMHKVVVLK